MKTHDKDGRVTAEGFKSGLNEVFPIKGSTATVEIRWMVDTITDLDMSGYIVTRSDSFEVNMKDVRAAQAKGKPVPEGAYVRCYATFGTLSLKEARKVATYLRSGKLLTKDGKIPQ